MSRRKLAPEIRAFEAYIAMDAQQRAAFAQLVRGYEYTANHKAPTQRAVRRRATAAIAPPTLDFTTGDINDAKTQRK